MSAAATAEAQAGRDNTAVNVGQATDDPFAGLSLATLHRLITETGCTTLEQVAETARPWPVEWLLTPREGDRPRVLELCMGPGGWRYGAHALLGAKFDAVGVDINPDAVTTARAAGHRCILADITTLDPEHPALRHTVGVIISPPCPPFATSGKHAGLLEHNLAILREAIAYVGEAAGFVRCDELDCGELFPDEDTCPLCEGEVGYHEGYAPRSGATWDEVRALLDGLTDSAIGLMLEVILWPMALQAAGAPIEWVAMEQSSNLPTDILEDLGIEFECADWCKSSWAVLEAADYGLATRRKRMFFIATRHRFVWLNQSIPGSSAPVVVEPKVPFPVTSLAEALGWPKGEIINTRGKRPIDPKTGRPKGGNCFSADKTGWCITGKTRTWYRESDEKRFTTNEAGRLVGFDDAYPWQGSRSSAFQRIGDVVSPVMSAVVLGVALQKPWEDAVRSHLATIYKTPAAALLPADPEPSDPAEVNTQCVVF